MKINEILTEVEGEFMPHETSTSGNMALQLLRKAKGDIKAAMVMADKFHAQLVSNIEKHSKHVSAKSVSGDHETRKSQPPARGYEPQRDKAEPRFSGRA